MSDTSHPVTVVSVRDPIRIVPLYMPAELLAPLAGAAPAPRLTYRGGPLLTAVKVFTVYWGAPWAAAPLSDTARRLDGFFDFVLTSELLDQLGEYSVPGRASGHGSRIGRAVVTAPAPRRVVSDAAIQHMLQQRAACKPMQHFGQPGLHPGTLARCHDHDVDLLDFSSRAVRLQRRRA